MITLKEWMELVDYRITEGDNYTWDCFGPKAYCLSSWNGDHNGYSFNIVFDTNTQEVYSVEACDYRNQRAYRIINPGYKFAHDDEAGSRDVSSKEAWDDVDYVDLDVDDDFIQKALAIKAGEDYDTRVSMPLVLDDGEAYLLMKIAHERDVTLNSLIEEMLQQYIDQHQTRLPKKKKNKRKD